MSSNTEVREKTSQPPQGASLFKSTGPAVMWALSSVGAGVIFYSPRVSARYGLTFLWAIFMVIIFTWFISREVGRYTTVTGKTLMAGFREVPGPRNWVVWIFFIAHMTVITLFVAGQAALAGSMAVLLAPGGRFIWTAGLILLSSGLILFGGYSIVNQASSWLAGILMVAALVMLVRVFPAWSKILNGLVPALPKNVDFFFLLPWIGFLLVHGVPWFSYWVDRQGYGKPRKSGQQQGGQGKGQRKGGGQKGKGQSKQQQLKGWVRVMSLMDGLGTALAGLFALVFYILGAQLLGNQQVAEGLGIGKQMAQAFQSIWGTLGLWIFASTAGIAFWTTVLDGQDGATRMTADITQIFFQSGPYKQGDQARQQTQSKGSQKDLPKGAVVYRPPGTEGVMQKLTGATNASWRAAFSRSLDDTKQIQFAYLIVLGTIAPIVLLAFYSQPLQVLSIAGVIGAGVIPFVAFPILWLNKTRLPKDLQPSAFSFWATFISGLFFTAVIVLYLLHLFGISLPFLP